MSRPIRFASAQTNDFADATITVQSGGILIGYTGARFVGGRLRSGMNTGELFIHAFKPFDIESVIEDNGEIPGILVKSGTGTLTLSGANTYTGDTYLNSGTLALEGDAAMTGICHQAGATVLSISNGARMTSLPTGRTLGGNLTLGAGAALDFTIGETDTQGDFIAPVTLENPWGAFTVTTDEPESIDVKINVRDGADIRANRTYRLIEWQPGTTLSGVSADIFAAQLPRFIDGEIVVTETGLDLAVRSVVNGMTIIIR